MFLNGVLTGTAVIIVALRSILLDQAVETIKLLEAVRSHIMIHTAEWQDALAAALTGATHTTDYV